MFRKSSISKNFLTLLLSITFLSSWAVCLSVCDEITTHHNYAVETVNIQHHGESCSSLKGITEGCKMSAATAIFQDNQIFKTSAPINGVLAAGFFHAPNLAWSALLPEIKQNSPPIILSKPLFVLLCTFRI